MDILKIPRMEKQEYDRLIEKGYICRIAFQGEKYPYIAPFLYVFDGSFLYFGRAEYGLYRILHRLGAKVKMNMFEYKGEIK